MKQRSKTKDRLVLVWSVLFAYFALALVCSTARSVHLVSVEAKNCFPRLTEVADFAVGLNLGFYGANGAYAGLSADLAMTDARRNALVGQVGSLDLAGHMLRPSSQRMEWNVQLETYTAHENVVGGSMDFEFDLARLSKDLVEPILLSGSRGWSWDSEGKPHMEMEFGPPLATTYFERDNKSELEAFFYRGLIAKGKGQYAVMSTVSKDVVAGPSVEERYGLANNADWPKDNLSWKASPVDLSFLNAPEVPAGKRGFVKVDVNQLKFADGSVARFWGTNVTAYSLFGTSKEVVRQQAKRLSALGFNLVRLHHHDSPWVMPNIFGDSKAVRDTQHLAVESLDQLDWWIKCLKDEGIYVWLDLHVLRGFKAGDNIFGFDEIRKGKDVADLRGYSYINPSIQEAMKRFNAAYVTHINPYTRLAYKDEPAIAAMLLTNENDLTNHFGNSLLPNKHVPLHNSLYQAEAKKFARKHGLTLDKVWRSWEHGPSKLFLNDLERRFNVDMLQHLRALGVRVPLVTTSTWGYNPLSSLPALTAGDVVDVHSYGGVGQLGINPLIGPNLTHWMSVGQVVGKPMTVTEWNAEPFPTPDRHTIPLFVASTASHQGWSGLMQYAYMQEAIRGPGKASNWHASNDPALLATLPAAALMYRQGHVKEATTIYVFYPSAVMLFNENISVATSPALRTAAELGKLMIAIPQTKELPWLGKSVVPKNAILIHDPAKALLEADATEATTDTGEIVHNWGKGTYTINTARTQAAMGFLGGAVFTLKDVTIKTTTRNASLAVQSLDGLPIARSAEMMISLGTRAVPEADNRVPYHVEPLTGELSIRAVKGLKLTKRDSQQQVKEVTATYRDGAYIIKFDESIQTNWLFLRKPQLRTRQ